MALKALSPHKVSPRSFYSVYEGWGHASIFRKWHIFYYLGTSAHLDMPTCQHASAYITCSNNGRKPSPKEQNLVLYRAKVTSGWLRGASALVLSSKLSHTGSPKGLPGKTHLVRHYPMNQPHWASLWWEMLVLPKKARSFPASVSSSSSLLLIIFSPLIWVHPS